MANVQTNRVAFLIPFIGPWPKWSGLFFMSCRHNPDVDVLLLTETTPCCPLPPNVHIVQTGLVEIVRRLEIVTGLELEKLSGHKLCDFRPFYGLAFADLLQPYEFWGYCDVDMMFGELSHLLSNEFLASIDVFSGHSDQFVGHFTIVRNCGLMNNAGFRIRNWRTLCLTARAEHVDEERFSDAIRDDPAIRWKRPESLKAELRKDFAAHGVTFSFFGRIPELDETDAPLLEWRDGDVLFHGEDGRSTRVLYVHFMATKHWWHWLFWNRNSTDQPRHYFSRAGYGQPKTVRAIRQIPWLWLYILQTALLHCKIGIGRMLRNILPASVFLQVRKMSSSLARKLARARFL